MTFAALKFGSSRGGIVKSGVYLFDLGVTCRLAFEDTSDIDESEEF